MTDNEIIKALEVILNREYPEDTVPTAVCTIDFIRGVSNIIDGLRSDVCYFEDRIDTINIEKNEIINRQKAEIERLKLNLEEAHIDIKEHMAKNERLHEVINGFEEQSHKEFLDYMELSEKYQNAKSEAIKEFAERFRKACIEDGIYPAFAKNIINNLVKEMTEGTK